jgi:putative hydrolase of the HAD superfamily
VSYQTIFFDLDNTLYTKESGVWQAMLVRIEEYMRERVGIPVDQIPTVRKSYLERFGTSLRGLLADYHIDAEDYLDFVHDVPIETMIGANPALAEMLAKLPQQKWIFTNSSWAHSQRVLAALGVQGYFDGVIDTKAMGYRSKPDAAVYRLALQQAGGDSASALFIDDQDVNLVPAKKLGCVTVLVGSGEAPSTADLVIGRVEDLLLNLPALVE